MDMDAKLCQQKHRWSLQLQSGEEITRIPRANKRLWVTDVFLVDPESVPGKGVVAACVEMGTRNIMLAQLSSDRTAVELQTPVALDKKYCFYVMRPGGHADADADTDTGADATVVQFEGFVLPLPSPDTNGKLEEVENDIEEAAISEDDDDRIEEDYTNEKLEEVENEIEEAAISEDDDDRILEDHEEEEEEAEEAVSSEDDDDRIDEDYEENEESDGAVDRDEGKDTRPRAAKAFLGLFLFSYMVAIFRFFM